MYNIQKTTNDALPHASAVAHTVRGRILELLILCSGAERVLPPCTNSRVVQYTLLARQENLTREAQPYIAMGASSSASHPSGLQDIGTYSAGQQT